VRRLLVVPSIEKETGMEGQAELPPHTPPERGAVFTEYALLITLIAGVVLISLGPIGAAVQAFFLQAWSVFP
jgi:Flp pilus assembly pilin Flp